MTATAQEALEDDWGDDEWELPDDAHWDDDCYAPEILKALEDLHSQVHGRVDLLACCKSPCNTIRREAIEAMQR